MLQQNIDEVSRSEPEGEVALNRRKELEEEELQQIERDKHEEDEIFERYIRRRAAAKRRGYTFAPRGDLGAQPTTERKPAFPKLVPFPSCCKIEELSLLEALREEPAITEPDALYRKCFEDVRHLKECGILDKYILSDEETVVLCVTTKLTESGFNFDEMLQSCKEKVPSRFAMLLLKSLRKLPQYKGTLYFGRGSDKPMHKVRKGCFVCYPFYLTSSSMATIRGNLIKFKFKQVFRVENCWGYDISDFVCAEDKGSDYCKILLKMHTLCSSLLTYFYIN